MWPGTWESARTENFLRGLVEREWLTGEYVEMGDMGNYMIVQVHLLSLLLSDSLSDSPISLSQEQVSTSHVKCSKRSPQGGKESREMDSNRFIYTSAIRINTHMWKANNEDGRQTNFFSQCRLNLI